MMKLEGSIQLQEVKSLFFKQFDSCFQSQDIKEKLSPSEQKKAQKWEKELAYRSIIPRTNILTCKVFLLNEKWKDFVSKDDLWSPIKLIEALAQDDKRISLILDLNRSSDYYNFEEFVQQNPGYSYIQYKKVPLEDKVVPDLEQVEKAHQILDEFFNKEGVIVVHCFNGRNRSGYVVGSYLCKKFNISAEEAIKMFNEARGLQIEYEVITEHLKSIYP